MSDNPFQIPAFLDRRGKKPLVKTRAIGTEAQHRQAAHRIAMDCRRLLEKYRRRQTRKARIRRRLYGGAS